MRAVHKDILMTRGRLVPIFADVDATYGDASMFSAHVIVDTGGQPRTEIARRTLETRILLALVTQMPHQGTLMHKGTPAVVTVELFVWIQFKICLTAIPEQSTVFQRGPRKPNANRLNVCNRMPITSSVSVTSLIKTYTSICIIVIISTEINKTLCG